MAQDEQIEACLQAHGVERGDGRSPTRSPTSASRTRTSASVDDPRFQRSRLEGILHGVSWSAGRRRLGARSVAGRCRVRLAQHDHPLDLGAAPRPGVRRQGGGGVVAIAVLALVALVLVALAMWPALAVHGAPVGADDPTLWSLAGTSGGASPWPRSRRGIGFAIATIGRNTAAALGAGFAYVIVLENIVGQLRRAAGGDGCCWATSSSSSPGEQRWRRPRPHRHRGRSVPHRGRRHASGRGSGRIPFTRHGLTS